MMPIAQSNAQPYVGLYRFPVGPYAFLEQPGVPDPALLQFDDPFTGIFDDLAAQNTRGALQAQYQDRDPANLSGLIQQVDVTGVPMPVLFLFN